MSDAMPIFTTAHAYIAPESGSILVSLLHRSEHLRQSSRWSCMRPAEGLAYLPYKTGGIFADVHPLMINSRSTAVSKGSIITRLPHWATRVGMSSI